MGCWPYANKEEEAYHDLEWGVPVKDDDTHMFEHLSLECLQCGLSWNYVLMRRPLFREVFCGFDIDRVAALDDQDRERILSTDGMLKNRRKVAAIIKNAGATQRVQEEFGSLCAYFWGFTEGKTLVFEGHPEGTWCAHNPLSAYIAKDLKRRGFSFVGPTTIYAHMQSTGIICDHFKDCERFEYLTSTYPCLYVREDWLPDSIAARGK